MGFKTRIKPSKEAIVRHQRELNTTADVLRMAPQATLITALNRKVRGWANYYRTVVSKAVFAACDHNLFARLLRWARRRHPNKKGWWAYRKYWTTVGADHWVFATPDGYALVHHTRTPIHRHVKVRGTASPYDGNLAYWAQRLRAHPLLTSRVALLLKRQRGCCARCGLLLRGTDILEVDHITPLALGGTTALDNSQVLHAHCHDEKTARVWILSASAHRRYQ